MLLGRYQNEKSVKEKIKQERTSEQWFRDSMRQ